MRRIQKRQNDFVAGVVAVGRRISRDRNRFCVGASGLPTRVTPTMQTGKMREAVQGAFLCSRYPGEGEEGRGWNQCADRAHIPEHT